MNGLKAESFIDGKKSWGLCISTPNFLKEILRDSKVKGLAQGHTDNEGLFETRTSDLFNSDCALTSES